MFYNTNNLLIKSNSTGIVNSTKQYKKAEPYKKEVAFTSNATLEQPGKSTSYYSPPPSPQKLKTIEEMVYDNLKAKRKKITQDQIEKIKLKVYYEAEQEGLSTKTQVNKKVKQCINEELNCKNPLSSINKNKVVKAGPLLLLAGLGLTTMTNMARPNISSDPSTITRRRDNTTVVIAGDNLLPTISDLEGIDTQQPPIVPSIPENQAPQKSIEQLQQEWNASVQQRYPDAEISDITAGVKQIQFNRYNSRITVVEINRAINPGLGIEPVIAGDSIEDRATVESIARNYGAIAAVNGTFFDMNQGAPLGLIIKNGQMLSSPLWNRVVLGINDDGFTMDKIDFSLNFKPEGTDESINIRYVNLPWVYEDTTYLYTEAWGNTAPRGPNGFRYVSVVNDVVQEVSDRPISIPHGGGVIMGPQNKLSSLSEGVNLSVDSDLGFDRNNFRHAISGGPYLVKDGNIYVDAAEEQLTDVSGRNPRTAVGFTSDGNLIMLTADGRVSDSAGLTFEQLAEVMQSIGASNAMGLDGGYSTQMVVSGRQQNNSGQVRSVPNALIVWQR